MKSLIVPIVPLTTLLLIVSSFASPPSNAWQPIPPVDWSKVHLSDFRDDELDLPFYLEHFHTVANAVVENGPRRGYLDIHVWRGETVAPYNARGMENYLALAFFYCTNRPWNPYYASPGVRNRLEAMLTYWCNMQSPDGRFSEYGPQEWNLPATAFATKFMGHTLALLNSGPPIDAALLQRITVADRKAIIATLTIPDLYSHGEVFSNQFCNVFAGAKEYTALHPDAEIDRLVDQVFRKSMKDFQSPAGFYYELNGADFGYTLYTHASDQTLFYNYVRGTPLGDLVEQEESRWVDWISYNLVREPDGSTFIINRCIESRQEHADWSREDSPLCEKLPLARAFSSTIEENRSDAVSTRSDLAASWGEPTHLALGGASYSPYEFVGRDAYSWNPTNQQRDQAVAQLPYIARDHFTHQSADSRTPLTCTFVRRPSYYAIFDSGTKLNPHQRYGIGLIWNPATGTVLQSQTGSDNAAWGTLPANAASPLEARQIDPSYSIAGSQIFPTPGGRDLPDGDLLVRYNPDQDCETYVRFADDQITVSVHNPGSFVEQLPLLTPGGRINISAGKAVVRYGQTQFVIEFDPAIAATAHPLKTIIAEKHLTVLQLPANNLLVYHMRFEPINSQ